MNLWKPIDTAPTDGTTVLLTWQNEPSWITSAYYEDGEWHENGSGYENALYRPTHWQPLPEPPTP